MPGWSRFEQTTGSPTRRQRPRGWRCDGWSSFWCGKLRRVNLTICSQLSPFRRLRRVFCAFLNVQLRVLYEDDIHCVVLKPAGMAVHGRGTQTLSRALKQMDAPQHGDPWKPVHRLDFGTRGPVCVAKTDAALQSLQSDWHLGQKTYHAWVRGTLPTPRGVVNLALEGKPSSTSFKTLGIRNWGVHGSASLVEWELLTGRTHQIRRHATAMGHPVVGDLVYGRPPHYTGHGLHLTCTRLQWLHPASKTPLDVTVAPAKKMIRAVPGTFKQVEDSPWLDLFMPDARS